MSYASSFLDDLPEPGTPPAARAQPPSLPWSGWGLALAGAITMGLMSAAAATIAVLEVSETSGTYLGLYGIGLLSPFLGALAYVRLSTGSLRAVARMYWPLRPGAGWAMIGAVPLVLVATYVVAGLLGLPVDFAAAPGAGALLVAAIGWSSVMWAEETAWRGTLLPVLQDRWGAFAATLVIAAVWALWHVPLLLLLGSGPSEFAWFGVQVLGLSAVMTWAWNRSGTALVPMLIHGVNNATMQWLVAAVPSHDAHSLMGVQAIGPFLLGLALVIATRGRLGR